MATSNPHLVQLLPQEVQVLLAGEGDVQPWGDGIDKVDAFAGGLLNELGELCSFLQCVQVPPVSPVLLIILWGIQV